MNYFNSLQGIQYVSTDLVFTCPMCADDIVVQAAVQVDDIIVEQTSDGRKSGPAEFGANIGSTVMGMRVRHECESVRQKWRERRGLIQSRYDRNELQDTMPQVVNQYFNAGEHDETADED